MPQRARICILTPGPIGSNPRVVKEADALAEAGFPVSVVSTRTLSQVDARDETLLLRIVWPAHRIDLRSRWRWRRLRALQATARLAYRALGARKLAPLAFSPITPALTAAAISVPADLYIAHYPAALPAAAAAARRHGVAYAYDAEDFHLGDWPDDPRYAMERRLVREIESAYLPGCAYVTAAAPAIADAYAQTYGLARPTVVLNCFPLENGPGIASANGSAEPGPSVYWFSQTIGPDRGLECAIRAIGLARTRPHLYLRGGLAANFGEQLRELATRADAVDRVHVLASAAPDDMERLAAPYDLGLASETGHTAVRRHCLSNKLFSYLVAGVPPLMSATPAQIAFAAEAGISEWVYPIDDALALAGLIDWMLATPARLLEARHRAFGLARTKYNWGQERERLLSTVSCAINI